MSEMDDLLQTFYPGQDISKIDDLKVQAMMFDMEVDWETLTLRPKSNKQSSWLERYLNRFNEGDNFSEDPAQNLEEDNGL